VLHEELLQQRENFHVVVDEQQSAHSYRIHAPKKSQSKAISPPGSFISIEQHFYPPDIKRTSSGKTARAFCDHSALGPDTPIVFQESCLSVSSDQSRIVLRRYFEQFSPTNAHWVEYVHSIAAADLIQWIMSHGQLHIECSDSIATQPCKETR
jgi:hypothetical protein